MVRWLGSMLMLLLVVACADDSDNGNVKDEPQGSQLRLSSATREGSTSGVTEGDIRVFVTTKDAIVPDFKGSFNKDNTQTIWNSSNLAIKENTQYYIYGYMPNKETVNGISSSIAKPAGGDYSAGAELILSGLPVFTDEDYRVIIGVQRVTDSETFTPATEGHYGYLSGIASQNYVNLLMGHLYSQLQLRFCVEKNYYALRCIHLKEVKLKSAYVAYGGTVTATVSLRDGKGLTGQVAFSDPAATTPTTPEEKSLLTGGNEELKVEPEANAEDPVYTVLSKMVNCAPCLFAANGAYLSVETTYDVYDRDKTQEHGNLIRENCKATNKIQVSGMAPGVRKMLTLTVAPTYLYMLSDPDLDNPTVHIGN